MAYGEFAKIYDELINEDINYDKMVNRIIEVCKKYDVDFINYLDVACGTGNVTVRLAKYFKKNYAVDLSEDMLREAFEKFKDNRIRCKVICQDMAELSLNKKFNLITSVLDSTNYIIEEDQLRNYFEGVKEHLNDDGIFIFDINSYYKLSQILGNNIYTYSEEEVFYTWENTFEDDLLSMFLTFFVKQGELYERFEEEHLERAYKEVYLERILEEVGLKVLEKFEGYSDKTVSDNSERIMYIVKKELK
ncbi:class I SAM-dependent DNA methyltransferase [Clostridium chauvoei]|uniref:Class I SAM-dependent methyltransferase n=2 Tax=Clostridium chauvoei TaxID=46867 RepID=A0ABD4REH3_9CLOT|nr:class I SAM-dependent methyltransferase [Clostridium chauvoei]ATD55282.1 SAM-dependent methyltransferase [Clostridium chauvoei]ATD57045.1 SAM-dependent methyltransferase [Clostridium chauvoei]MBX7279633.1 class I SAM-dependent methyltransferase [Clostridium chauvoei]MBX7282002.1 class I SAM-dependent methyltransferase [Clostridium chauvoei]MBX7284409.1 class I SAM-dependent methyltransferase [Clostridium chauvoei]